MILIFIFVCFIGGWIVLLTLAAVMAGRRGRVLSKGRNLQAKFRGLGRIAGRTRGDIVRAVGPPNSFSSLAGGKILLQWISPATTSHLDLMAKVRSLSVKGLLTKPRCAEKNPRAPTVQEFPVGREQNISVSDCSSSTRRARR